MSEIDFQQFNRFSQLANEQINQADSTNGSEEPPEKRPRISFEKGEENERIAEVIDEARVSPGR